MEDFLYKPFDEMTAADYATVGFKSGLEVHQQLLTKRKLFCRCPAGRYSTEYHAEILRHMRPTLSELGEYDGTALMEFKTKKEIIYRINRETVCTYEMDDTPPFMMDDEALEIALEISLLAQLSVVDEIHIARKQYLDGSIPTGFQRTTILGVNGSVPYGDRQVGIIQLGLEEDSCREVSDVGHLRTYLTDRLGMPLIELVTAPDMRTPHEVAEVANILRNMMRSTQKVRRGLGATRADTNVSVTGGTRIEIKGVPNTWRMPLLTYNESRRQWNLLRLREELKRRGITTDTFQAEARDVTRVLRRAHFAPIADTVQRGGAIHAVKLPGWAELLRWETQEGTTFSKEIADRVRVIACLSDLPNIIHSDTTNESISGVEWNLVKKAMHFSSADSLVIVWGSARDVETAAKEIIIRAREATIGIPSETRQALRDGTTGFERILPGPQRMYPDTDLPPKRLDPDAVERIRMHLPVQFWDRRRRWKELGVAPDAINGLSISPLATLFDEAVEQARLPLIVLVNALWRHPRRLRREGTPEHALRQDDLRAILAAVADSRLTPDGILAALRQSVAGAFDADALPPRLTRADLAPVIERAKAAVLEAGILDSANLPVLTLDRVMDEVRGRIPGADVAAEVTALVGAL
jgi:glutamyl-tRNA(Gln) amidotransferase subunit E